MKLFDMSDADFGKQLDNYQDSLLNEHLDPRDISDQESLFEYDEYLEQIGFYNN